MSRLLCLSGSDVERVAANFDPIALQNLMARVFYTLSSNKDATSFTPHRIIIPTPNHSALFMPARIATPLLSGTSVKIVCVPKSPTDLRGLPASTLVLDEDTGSVKAILNAKKLTALRNAAGSLLSFNIIGTHNVTNLVVFGAGAQIQAHLDLFLNAVSGISRVTIVNRTINERAKKVADSFRTRFPAIQVECLANDPTAPTSAAETSVSSAQLIICATSSTIPLFPSSWVRDGTHIILIGSYTPSMHEVDGELIQRAIPSLLVDSRGACAAEAGEIIAASVEGSQMVEIGELVSFDDNGELVFNSAPQLAVERGTGNTGRVSIFKSVGVGLQDVAIASAVVDEAQKMGVGSYVDWD
ncbi:hypothetical protein FB45DRAFT_900374 [Roridomyces roridus]|uniref:Uncharacterized protein n=1 Tax=Roridomyces roridus TaxID=1738132 RepID=A0AAD7FSY1_9AGAR|nr:hypothetical protein FB45DRAFT_900374 [Roridomyces roridus]